MMMTLMIMMTTMTTMMNVMTMMAMMIMMIMMNVKMILLIMILMIITIMMTILIILMTRREIAGLRPRENDTTLAGPVGNQASNQSCKIHLLLKNTLDIFIKITLSKFGWQPSFSQSCKRH